MTDNTETVYAIIRAAVESESETPSFYGMQTESGLTRTQLSNAIGILLQSGRVIKHSGGWATVYQIPGDEKRTVSRSMSWESKEYIGDRESLEDANRKFVRALAEYFKKRQSA